uniref:Elongator complex protein 5 n=1 Tax=Molossus molossus TaxID=27622 RepID=A0A7J8CXL8_MOLMO|nr:elongator acetyltransferase complex subunit 5 [Molossus molossus]
MCRRTGSGPVTIALDSLSWLLLHLPCTILCQTLHALSHQDSRHDDSSPVEHMHVLGLLHEELHGPGPVEALSTLAQTEVTLSGTGGHTLAHILYRRPQQHPTHKTQWFSILPDFSLDLQGESPLKSQPHSDPHIPRVSKFQGQNKRKDVGSGKKNKNCRGWGWGQITRMGHSGSILCTYRWIPLHT